MIFLEVIRIPLGILNKIGANITEEHLGRIIKLDAHVLIKICFPIVSLGNQIIQIDRCCEYISSLLINICCLVSNNTDVQSEIYHVTTGALIGHEKFLIHL